MTVDQIVEPSDFTVTLQLFLSQLLQRRAPTLTLAPEGTSSCCHAGPHLHEAA